MIYLLIIYFIYLVAFIVYSVAGIYHLWRFGYIGDLTKPVIIVYSTITVLIIIVSIILVMFEQWPRDFYIS